MSISIRRLIAPVLVIAGGIGVFALLHVTKPEPEKSTEEPRPTSVYTAPVQQSDAVLEVTTQGELLLLQLLLLFLYNQRKER